MSEQIWITHPHTGEWLLLQDKKMHCGATCQRMRTCSLRLKSGKPSRWCPCYATAKKILKALKGETHA